MTAGVATDSKNGRTLPVVIHTTKLVPVVYKKSRLHASSLLNFHTHKAFGAVLDSQAVRGKGFVVRRTMGQDPIAVMAHLKALIQEREETING